MEPLRLGIDVTDVQEWSERLHRCPRVAATAFTARELDESGGRPERLAVLWAVKEASVKALGSGFGGIGWRGVEVGSRDGHPRWVRLAELPPQVPPPGGAIRLALRTAGAQGQRRPVVAAAALGDRAGGTTAARVDRVPRLLARQRAGRAAHASAAVRRTAEEAASTVVRGRAWRWGYSSLGAPCLSAAGGRRLSVALAHGAGLAAALVGVPHTRPGAQRAGSPSGQRSTLLTIIDDDDLLEGVSVRG